MLNQGTQNNGFEKANASLRRNMDALLPALRSYAKLSRNDDPELRMPFVRQQAGGTSFWSVPYTDCYGSAYILGQEYAGHYLQYLKDQPSNYDNTLGMIIKDMGGQGGNNGFVVGFLTYLEMILSDWAKDQPVYDRLTKDREESIRANAEAMAYDFRTVKEVSHDG